MPSECRWSRHLVFPAHCSALSLPLHSGVHCSACCRASSIRRPHVRTFIAPSNHCAIVAEKKSSYPISHVIFFFCHVITSVIQHSPHIKNENYVQCFLGKFGREEKCGLCLNLTLNCSAWALIFCKNLSM